MEPAKDVERPIRMRGRDGRRVGQAGLAIAALALTPLLTGCTDGATNFPSAAGDPAERQAEIHTAALERFLQQAPERLGHHADVLVVSRAVEGGGLSTARRETRNIARDVQEAISRQVGEVGSLTWVPHSRQVLTVRRHRGHVGTCSIVSDGDMVVTLDVLDEPRGLNVDGRLCLR